MNMLTTFTADRPATAANVGFIPSPGLLADIARFRAMRSTWDHMAAAALDFDSDSYERAKARFDAATEGR